ncbi:purine-cytosine permease family protein [Arthrobacter sp. 35W]|uniref:purine-cytosine permease family protein n=1 Tax=Arthrobacter sp. 35W TaxID=1132441 RepID=UPI00041AB373|nr:cytosine permease [Arthrobacter sp. 35W]
MARVNESSTAEDRGYRDSLTKVEPYGVEHIPEVERHGKPSSQFFIWFAAGMNFPIIVLGFSAAYFGLSMGQAVIAILAGALIGSVVMGIMSRMGVRLGVPQQMQARGPLGFIGNLFPVAYVNVFAGIGWAAVTVILGGKALAELTGVPFWITALVLMLLQLLVAVIGYNLIHFLQRILAIVLFFAFVMITIVTVTRGGTGLPANPEAEGFMGAGSWITFFGYFLAFLVAWLPFASDYSRYLPDTPTIRRRTGIFTMLGNFTTVSWMGIVGVVLAGTATTSDPIAALNELMGPWAVPGLLAIAVSSFSQNFLNVYGGAISIQTMGVPVKRTTGVVFICVASYLVALWGQNGIYEGFSVFLNLTAYFIAPFAMVLICDYYLGGRQSAQGMAQLFDKTRKFEWGFVAWAAGVVGSVPFWVSSLYTGPVAAAFPEWGDLSMFVAAAIAVVVYLATYKLRPLSKLVHLETGATGTGSTEAAAEALSVSARDAQ